MDLTRLEAAAATAASTLAAVSVTATRVLRRIQALELTLHARHDAHDDDIELTSARASDRHAFLTSLLRDIAITVALLRPPAVPNASNTIPAPRRPLPDAPTPPPAPQDPPAPV